jgi:two-component system nitrate/nitrite response regulator NarL
MPAPLQSIRLLLVNSQPIVRAGLRMMLNSRCGVAVVSEATAPGEAVTSAAREPVDIVLVAEDLTEGCLDALPLLVRACHPAHVIVFADNLGNVANERAAVRAGVKGLVRKDASLDTLISAIQKVQAGELWLSRLLAAALSDFVRPNEHERTHVAHSGLLSLTRREIGIIALICDGLTNAQIANCLFISETTVRHHLTSIFAKLGVGDRLKLAVYAFRHGLAAAGTGATLGKHRASPGAPARAGSSGLSQAS